jgi:hypothetical protein
MSPRQQIVLALSIPFTVTLTAVLALVSVQPVPDASASVAATQLMRRALSAWPQSSQAGFPTARSARRETPPRGNGWSDSSPGLV